MCTWLNEHWTNRYAVLAFLAFFYVLSWNTLASTDFTAEKIAAWVGAIGTVGALAVAIWLSNRDTSVRNRDAYTHAMIVASEMFHPVDKMANDLLAIHNLAAATSQRPGDVASLREVRNRIAALKLWSSEEIGKLAPLPDNCARRISRAQFNIGMFLEVDWTVSIAASTTAEWERHCKGQAREILVVADDLSKARNVLISCSASLNQPNEFTLGMMMDRNLRARASAQNSGSS